jgi:CBS domain containing-hemolysin-like protein
LYGDGDNMKKFFVKSLGWSTKITVLTIFLAGIFATLSTIFLSNSSIIFGMAIVLFFISLGIISDTVGLSAAAAKEIPFHAMASKKIKGAREAVHICKNAEVFSSFFNDVVGDISGIVSGTATASVVLQLSLMAGQSDNSNYYFVTAVIFTSVVAGLTVGGKALCKTLAIRGSTEIIFTMGKMIYFLENRLGIPVFARLQRSKNRKTRLSQIS